MNAPKLSRRQLLVGGISTLVGAPLIEANWEPLRLEAIHRKVPIRGLGKEFSGFRIGVMSDIHWGNKISWEFVHRASRLLLEFNPDLIVIPGDFVHGKGAWTKGKPTFNGAFDLLKAPEGVVGVLGNHDHWAGANHTRKAVAIETNVRLIDNDGFVIQRGANALAVGGIGDLWEDRQDLEAAFRKVDREVPRILLSHNPDTAESLSSWSDERVDLQISGHTHGGQIVIPGVVDFAQRVSKYGSKFNRGLVEGASHRVFVSKGVGRPNGLRLGALPDVACLELITS